MTIQMSQAIGGPVPMGEDELRMAGAGGIPDGDQIKSVIIFQEKITAGTQTVNTVSDAITSPDEAETLAGLGSPAACMARRFMEFKTVLDGSKAGPKAKIRLAVITEEAVGVVASQTLTFATSSTGDGQWKHRIGRYTVVTPVRNLDDVTTQGDNFVAAFNNAEIGRKLPLTAVNAVGVVTIAATAKGAFPNSIGLVELQDPDVTTTATLTGAYMGDDSGTGIAGANTALAAAFATALTAIAGNEDCAAIVTAWNEDAEIEAIIDSINTRGDATNKIASYLYVANNSEDTATKATARAAQITWSAGLDSDDAERVNCGGIYGTGDWSGFQAAASAALRATENHLARSLNGLVDEGVPIPADADKYTRADLALLLEAGFTPWYAHKGKTLVGMCRHVMCRDSWGVKDFSKIQVPDLARQRLSFRYGLIERPSIVADDAELPAEPHVTKPMFLIATGYAELKAMEREAYITDVDDLMEVVKSELSGTEVRQAFPVKVVEQLHNRMTRYDVDMS